VFEQEPFTCTIHDGLVAVQGEVDGANAAGIRFAVQRAVSRGLDPVTVDLSRVTFFGARGVAALLGAQESVRACGSRLVLTRCSPAVRRTLELTRADAEFDIADRTSKAR
jgi:anti-anti-sigma factor